MFRKTALLKKSWNLFVQAKTYATEAKFPTKPFRLHRLDKGPASSSPLTKEEALKYFELMTSIRKMETAIGNFYKAKKVRGFCHLYSGQEAVGIGIFAALRPQDSVITSYRCHSWCFLYNEQGLVATMAELLGNELGCSRGKGGSMHMYGKNFFGGNGIVGSQVPMGTGLAFAYKYKKTDAVSVTLYGDGAANNGQVSEAFNMAKLWSLPCVFVCENNRYGMGTSTSRSSANTDFYTRGDLIPGVLVDGMDFFSVREASRFAVEHCTSGKGPILLEMDTYRYFGHSMSDPGTSYRSRDEIQQVRKTKDPINSFKKHVVDANLVTEDEFKKIDAKVKKEVAQAEKKAQTGKEIKVDELTYDVYSNNIITEIRAVDPFKMAPHKTAGRALNVK